jgi:hypothetical protein
VSLRINTKIVIDIATLEVIERASYEYVGPVALAKASSQETQIGAGEQNFFNTLSADYGQQFGNQSAILNTLNADFQPILAGGINQQGFSPSELATLNTQNMDQTSAEYQKAATAAGERAAAAGGGNTYLPSGVNQAVQANIAAQAAGQEAAQGLQIQEANFAQGRQNFLSAANELGGVASQFNPLGYAGQTTGAGGAAFGAANTIAQQNDTFGQVAGILGGATDAWLGHGGNPFSTPSSSNTPPGSTLGNPYFTEDVQ